MSFAKMNVLVDVVSARNDAIGVSFRNDLLDEGKNFRTAHVLVFSKTGSIALQKLHKDHNRSPTKLGSSVAGYVLSGEDYTHAAIRKTKDELRIDADLRQIGTVEMRDLKSLKFVGVFICEYHETISNYDKRQISSIVYHRVEWLEIAVRRTPNKFTDTFLKVFELYQIYARATNTQRYPFKSV